MSLNIAADEVHISFDYQLDDMTILFRTEEGLKLHLSGVKIN